MSLKEENIEDFVPDVYNDSEDTEDGFSDEEYEHMMDDYYEWKEARLKRYKEFFEKYWAEMLSGLGEDEYEELYESEFNVDNYLDIAHVGFGIAEVDENYHNGFYPDYRFFKFTDIEFDEEYETKDLEYMKNFHFMEQNMSETGMKELCYQVCGMCGDDYSGYICWPMKDGRWWICEFAM